ALAEAYGRAGKHDRAARWLAEARREIDAMVPEANRSWPLAALAEAQGRLGRTGAARATLDEAEAHALKQPDDPLPGWSLHWVIGARVAVGALDGAAGEVRILGDRARAAAMSVVVAARSAIGDRAAAKALLATIADADSRALAAKADPNALAFPQGPGFDA